MQSPDSTWQIAPSPATRDINILALRPCSVTIPLGAAGKGQGAPRVHKGEAGSRTGQAEGDARSRPKSRLVVDPSYPGWMLPRAGCL